MQTERETKEVTLKSGKKLVHKAWLTLGESQQLQSVYLKGAKLSVVNGQPQIDDFDPNIETEAKNKLIELLVVSIDDVTDGLVDYVLNLKQDDGEEIVNILDTLAKKK